MRVATSSVSTVSRTTHAAVISRYGMNATVRRPSLATAPEGYLFGQITP